MHGFSKKLIAVAGESVAIDAVDLDRPEPSAAGLVTEMCCFVRGADKNALTRFDYFLAAVAGAIAFDSASNESLERGSLGLIECADRPSSACGA
jgi:hypothetical protein